MKRLRLSAVLSAVSVLTVAAVGQSSTPVDGNVQMMDFEEENDVILGYPDGGGPLGWYKRVANTAHLPGVIPPKTPPNPVSPCRALTKVWNILVTKVPPGPGRNNALLSVLTHMTQHQCRADISRDESQSPAPIISIKPTPQ